MKNPITLSPAHADFLERTFARNRAIFGGYSLELEGEEAPPEGNETDEQNPEDQESGEGEQQAETPAEGEDEQGEEESGEDDSDLTLEDAKGALAKVRRENATWRTRYAELEKKLEGATAPEQIEAIKEEVRSEVAADSRALLVENVALKHSLPEELADALKGDTREELEAHAKVLAKFVPVEPEEDPDLEGGLDAGKPGSGFDPKATARANSRRRRF